MLEPKASKHANTSMEDFVLRGDHSEQEDEPHLNRIFPNEVGPRRMTETVDSW